MQNRPYRFSATALAAAGGLVAFAIPTFAAPVRAFVPTSSHVLTCGPTSGAGEAPWTTFDGDAARSGDGVDVTATARTLHQLWKTFQLDGAVYAQPLVAGGCLFVATENNTVYAFGATSGAERWQVHLAPPVTSGLPCGNIDPSGITGTPVLDPANGELWVVVATQGRAGPEHEIVALNASNGRVLRHQVIAVPGRNPAAEQERAALTLANGNVYVALGGLYGDCANYVGAVASVPVSGGRPGYWEVPTARQAGIWEPGGPDVLANGDLLVADGNGAASPGQRFDGSDAVIRLAPDLRSASYFAPTNWAQLNVTDQDLGSSGPALLPGGLAFQAGKAGTGYLVSTARLGGVGGELSSAQICEGGDYGANAVSGETVYVPCSEALVAVDVSGTRMHVQWRARGGGEGSPVVAGGRVFEETNSGQLEVFDPTDGAVLQSLNFASPVTHFAWLVGVGGDLYAPDGQSVVALGGL
jgi:outer membrane protein assembly factor BamB